MMFPSRLVAALAAVALTLALAVVPVASARAAQPRAATPQVHQVLGAAAHSKTVQKPGLVTVGGATPGSLICVLLARQIQFALAVGNPILANLLARTAMLLGCGGAAI